MRIRSVDNLTFENNSFQSSSLTLQQVNTTVITGCNFTDNFSGSQTNPGALYIEGGSATIKHSRFINNRPDSVYVNRTNSLFVSDSVFEGLNGNIYKAMNIAKPRDSVVVLRCNFTRNSGSGSGAVSIQSGTSTDIISFTECNFMGNSASASRAHGGAISIQSGARTNTISFIGCNFMDNSVLSRGGALYILTSTFSTHLPLNISFTGCQFKRNHGPSGGGAFYIETRRDRIIRMPLNISFTGCQFIENSASSGGGALLINTQLTTLPIYRLAGAALVIT
jgi:hypothetical protein